MAIRSFSLLSALFFFLGACTGGHGPASTVKDSGAGMPVDTAGKSQVYTVAMVDNKKDPSCGMPVTAGIGDTVHYQGKVIGFCSKECKDEFLKDPVAGLKKTEFKK